MTTNPLAKLTVPQLQAAIATQESVEDVEKGLDGPSPGNQELRRALLLKRIAK